MKSHEMREFNPAGARAIILFPLITSASATFNERGALDDSSTLPQLVRDSRGSRIAEQRGGEGRKEKVEDEEEEQKRKKKTELHISLRFEDAYRPGCLIDDDDDDSRREGGEGRERGRARIAGSEVERCSIDSCHEAATPPPRR